MPQKGTQPGCLVKGRITTASGKVAVNALTIQPDRQHVTNGTLLTDEPDTIPVNADGTWQVKLPPGRYRVTIGSGAWTINVPFAQATANFTELIQYD
jgi:hypothetical protein